MNATLGYGIAYLYDTSDKPQGYGGGGGPNFDARSALLAIDVRTGAIKWKHEHEQRGFGAGGMSGGILTTAGNLLFTGDSGGLTAFDPARAKSSGISGSRRRSRTGRRHGCWTAGNM